MVEPEAGGKFELGGSIREGGAPSVNPLAVRVFGQHENGSVLTHLDALDE